LMHALIALQVAFCFVVYFAAGLFVTTFNRLARQSTGFSAERILTLDTGARNPQPPAFWSEVSERLRAVPGIEAVALAGWPLLSGTGWNGFIWVDGAPTEVLAYFLGVSPGWTKTMNIPFIDGRDLGTNEMFPGTAIVNETFARRCFGGRNPMGRWFEKETGDGVTRARFRVVGMVHDARYRNMREPITPTAYVPFHSVDSKGVLQPKAAGTFIVRTSSSSPMSMASQLRREVQRIRPEFRVSNIRTQQELNEQHTVRERLLAMLALFFAVVAMLLCGIGLYGVLDYSVVQKRREIGIRIAIGARAGDIARRVTLDVFSMVLLGAAGGVALGAASLRYIETLLYQVKATDLPMFAVPAVAVVAAALLAAAPPVFRAIRVDPVTMLRTD
jgi:predicted permease